MRRFLVVVLSMCVTVLAGCGGGGGGTGTATTGTGAGGSGSGTGTGTTGSTSTAPSIASVTPSSGPLGGGTTVVVSGAGLDGVSFVLVGNALATNVTVLSPTELRFTTPSSSVIGATSVTLNALTRGRTVTPNAFTYLNPPTVTAVSPASGPASGGTAVTITGSEFESVTSVTFGTGAASSVEVVSKTEIRCVTPAGTGTGQVNVRVVSSTRGAATGANLFTYNPVPVVQTVTPSTGLVTGGTSITVTGSGFVAGQTVTIGGAPVSNLVVASATSFTCLTPPGSAGAQNVSVTVPNFGTGTATGAFTYLGLASIASITPLIGRNGGGTQITITGQNLTGASVTLDGVACTGVIATATSVTAITPGNAGGPPPRAVTIALSTPNNGTATFGTPFTYQPDMNIATLTPDNGPLLVPIPVTIGGSNFPSTPPPAVMFGTRAATSVVVVNANTITCSSPPGLAVGPVSVTLVHPDRGTNSATYTYNALPSASINPNQGPFAGGTPITITGSGFGGTVNVTIGGNPCPPPISVNGPQTVITCVTPPGTIGNQPVIVGSSTNGTVTATGGFTYNPRPTVTAVIPAAGTSTGGTVIDIRGTGFAPSMNVTLGTITATVLSVTGATTVTCRTNAGPVGPQSILVESSTHGVSLPGATIFTYRPPAAVLGALPNTSVFDGNIPVEIFGTDFDASPTPTVLFGGVPALVTSVTAPTTIRCIAPATALTPLPQMVTLTVSSTTMGMGTLPNGFTYTSPVIFTVAPPNGPSTGGTAITIGGKGFSGVTSVTVDGNPCTITGGTGTTTVTATTPAGTLGAKNVVVNTGSFGSATANGAFTYYAAATVTGVLPGSGVFTGGQTVEVFGADIRALPLPTVRFGPNAAVVQSVTVPTTITCVVPASTSTPLNSTVDVTISSTSMGVGVGSNAYTYTGPSISTVSPNFGPASGGTEILITGEGFQGVTGVLVGGTPCTGLVVPNTTRITATVPSGVIGFQPVQVNTSGAGNAVLGAGFNYTTPVSLLTINPTSSSFLGNITVDIGGMDITSSPTPTVLIDSQQATVTAVTGTTTITAIVPPTARAINTLPATVVVTVTSPTMGTDEINFTYRPPFISALTPAAGPITGGTLMTITGGGFVGITSVLVDGRPCDNLNVPNPSTITVNVTTGTQLGLVPVQINSSVFGTLSDPAFQFTFNPAFATPITVGVGSGPENLVIADFNGDGRKDIAVCNVTGGSVAIARNAPDLSFPLAPNPPGTQFSAGGLPKAIAAADMDRDGWLDVVTASQSSGAAFILRNAMPLAGLGTPRGFELGAPTTDPTLRQPVGFFVGTSLCSLALADYNLDGATDVAGTGINTNELFVATNAGAPGTLALNASNVTPSAGAAPTAIVAGDLNNDGKPDIALVNRDSPDNQLAVFVNISAPGGPNAVFDPPRTFTVNASPTSVKLGDVNGDGFPDVICGCGITAGATNISTLINKTAPGTLNVSFSALGTSGSRSFLVGERPIGTALVDMNADGRPDIVSVADVLQAFSFRLNLTQPAFGTDADPAFGNNSEIALGVGPTALGVEDMDGDGRKDLVTVNQGSNTISVFLNQTVLGSLPATFTENPTRTVVEAGPVSLDVADLNGDGLPDVAVTAATAGRLSTFTSSTTPGSLGLTFNATANFATAAIARGLSLGDVTFDGRPDALVGSFDAGIEEFRLFPNTTPLGTPDPTFAAPIVNAVGGGAPRNAVIGDINADGLPDLAISDPSAGGVLLYRNTGPPGAFVFASFLPVNPGPVVGLALVDFNGDGKPEIIATDESANLVSLFENVTPVGGAFDFGYSPPPDFVGRAFPLSLTTLQAPVAVAAGDFNGDGKLDLAVANRVAGAVTVILNNTDGVTPTYGSRDDFATGTSASSVAVADVSRDGRPDLIVSNSGSNTVTVLINQTPLLGGLPVFTKVASPARTILPTGTAPADVKVRDMNGDGLPDLIIPNTIDGTVSIFRNTTP